MPHHFPKRSEDADTCPEPLRESPHHGFQGDRAVRPETPRVPISLTVAISREAGSRGGSIARRAGEKLGWQVYTQDLLEYVAQEGSFRQEVLDNLPPAAAAWVAAQLRQPALAQSTGGHPSALDLAHLMLALGAQGEVILIGRGSGCLLPPRSTLHVRVVAPLADRIAYMTQWLRLTSAEAAAEVNLRDSRRNQFIETHFQRRPTDLYQYDLVLNTSLLGEELFAELIVQAARAKLAALDDDASGGDKVSE